ncbi:hypothetical protein PIB30_100222 [Stylosanthes scabra]|uniref:Uncharacterized protein n=1 Tax=Stylosanthes scabra TaxID=79078 RepID=A0ABU6UW03_9FABA|nr:hypothetical protein [Stylosanthes scabra]
MWFYSLLVGSDGMLWPARKTHRGQLTIALEYGTNVILGYWWSRLESFAALRKHVTFSGECLITFGRGRSRLALGLPNVTSLASFAWSRLSFYSPNMMSGRLGLAFGLVLEDACHVWDLTPNVTWEGTKHEGNEA